MHVCVDRLTTRLRSLMLSQRVAPVCWQSFKVPELRLWSLSVILPPGVSLTLERELLLYAWAQATEVQYSLTYESSRRSILLQHCGTQIPSRTSSQTLERS